MGRSGELALTFESSERVASSAEATGSGTLATCLPTHSTRSRSTRSRSTRSRSTRASGVIYSGRRASSADTDTVTSSDNMRELHR